MDNIRCLIADIQEIVLADIVQRIAEDSPGIDIVSRVDSTENLYQLIQDNAADVVILGIEADELSKQYTELLDAFPGLVMLGIIGNGRRALVIVDDIGPQQLTGLIQSSTRGNITTNGAG